MVTEPVVGDATVRRSSTRIGGAFGNQAADVVLGASMLAGLAPA
jgi:hypothetical protein